MGKSFSGFLLVVYFFILIPKNLVGFILHANIDYTVDLFCKYKNVLV